jgi:uncharacterized protein YukE
MVAMVQKSHDETVTRLRRDNEKALDDTKRNYDRDTASLSKNKTAAEKSVNQKSDKITELKQKIKDHEMRLESFNRDARSGKDVETTRLESQMKQINHLLEDLGRKHASIETEERNMRDKISTVRFFY